MGGSTRAPAGRAGLAAPDAAPDAACAVAAKGPALPAAEAAPGPAGLALGAVAAPSLAQSSPTRADFDRLDRNHDGVVSFDKYRAR